MAKCPLLIVDDDPAFVSFITAVLSQHGRTFEVAVCGSQALAIFREVRVQGVLLDLRLPDPEGVDVLREIVNTPNHPPVILVSGAASISSAWEPGRLRAAGYLEKPFRVAEMLTLLDQLSASSQDVTSPPSRNANSEGVAPVFSTSATNRLAQAVVRASLQSADFKHGRGLAQVAHIGYGTMRHWCRIARVPGRAFVKFTRGFWATRSAKNTGRVPFELLDSLEPKTGAKILDPSLPAGTTIEEYCARQTHLPPSHPLVLACLSLFAAPGLPTRMAGRTGRLVPGE